MIFVPLKATTDAIRSIHKNKGQVFLGMFLSKVPAHGNDFARSDAFKSVEWKPTTDVSELHSIGSLAQVSCATNCIRQTFNFPP
jgi:hypothetical protein